MKKKRKLKKWVTFLMIFFFLLLFGLTMYLMLTRNFFSSKHKEEPKVEEKEEVKESTISLIMVGDNLIHGSVYADAYRLGNYNTYDFKPMVSRIKEIVSNYDLAYYNQETILGGKELGLSHYPRFNSPYETGDAMVDAGFNLVSLATNHTLDKGEKAVLNSRNYWNSKTDVLAVGSYSSKEERDKIDIREKNGISYAMLNYTYGTNGLPVPYGKEYLVDVWPTDLYLNDPARDTEYQNYKEQVKLDIEKLRDKVDVLIVAMHWGVEYTFEPTEYEKDSAQFLADQGVDIVIGTHPHVIQPVEWIDDTIVFYSLGNFISAQYQDEYYNKMVGLMSSLIIKKTEYNDEVNISIENVENELIYTYYNKYSVNDFKVIPFSHPDIKTHLPEYLNVYEYYKKIVQNLDQNMVVKPVIN